MGYKAKTRAIIKEVNNLSKLVVTVVNTSTSEVKKFLFNLFGSSNSKAVSNEVSLDIKIPLSEKGIYQITYSVDNPLYQPVVQYLSVADDSPTEIQLPQVVIAPINQFKNVTIRIVDALNGQPVPDASVQVIYGGDNYNATINDFSGYTNNEGKIFLENLQYGVYSIRVAKENYQEAIYTLKVDDTTPDIVDLTLSPVLPENEIRIVLTWGETPSDLDAHLVKVKDGNIEYHLYWYYADSCPDHGKCYGSPTDEANLDIDDITSFGPETVTIHNLDTNATYKYYVHDYSTCSGDTSTALANSGATVKVYWGDRTYTYYVPNLPGTAWKVFEIVNGTLIPCTGEECVFGVSSETDSQFGTRAITPTNFEIELFKNLPKKQF
jgi:5-hydroxyisourate hydrolase-like protein (transthyretin family)